MTHDSAGTPKPDAALRALGRLVGTWHIGGDATGSITFRSMDGGFFFTQVGELTLSGHTNRFLEVTGRERPFGGASSEDIVSRVYTAAGDTLAYVYELTGDSLTIWFGDRESGNSYTVTLTEDDTLLTGAWSWPGGGYATTSTRQLDASSANRLAGGGNDG